MKQLRHNWRRLESTIEEMRLGQAGMTAQDQADTVVIAFYCNAGEHRSVAMAELFGSIQALAPTTFAALCGGGASAGAAPSASSEARRSGKLRRC